MGDCVVFNWPAEKLNRPVDKKENYVKRCVGIAGDKIEIVNGQLMVNDEPQAEPEGMKKQFTYNVKTKGSGLNPKLLYKKFKRGSITQLVECMLCKHKVIGSIPITSNSKKLFSTFQDGFEPSSWWLTATRSTPELLKKLVVPIKIRYGF